MEYYVLLAFYLLRTSIRVQLAGLQSQALRTDSIGPGEIVESISAASERGRILIRHHGRCYRVWKEELQDRRTAERLGDAGDSQPSASFRGECRFSKSGPAYLNSEEDTL